MIDLGFVAILVAGLAVVIMFMAVKQVPQGQEWTVERFGRYTNTLRPGLSFILPMIDQIGSKLIMMEQETMLWCELMVLYFFK